MTINLSDLPADMQAEIAREYGPLPKGKPHQPKARDYADDLQKIAVMAGLPTPEREAKLIPGRKFQVDLLFRAARLVVEVEGGIFRSGGGAHSRPGNIMRDIIKYNELMLLGYRVLRVTPDWVKDGRALGLIEDALSGFRDAGAGT